MHDALLLIGHSNSGKSPLGSYLEQLLSGPSRRFIHCDFGHLLRGVCAGAVDAGLSAGDLAYVRSVMQGTLITREHFPVIHAVMAWFLARSRVRPAADILILNGMPRNIDQAGELGRMEIAVRAVIRLDCTVETALERKKASESGAGFEERGGRGDATAEIFGRKIRSYEQETAPLLEYYVARRTPVFDVTVLTQTSPDDMVAAIGAQRLLDVFSAGTGVGV